MTLKGKNNHYNVKLLRGYGVSIRLHNSKIILKDGQDDIIGRSEIEEWFITNLPYEKIVISGKGYISTEAISLLNQNNRNVVLVDTYGHPVSLINGTMESLTATRYHMAPLSYIIIDKNLQHCQDIQETGRVNYFVLASRTAVA